MKPILLRTGRPVSDLLASHGEYEAWFARRLGWPVDRLEVIDGTDVDAPLPAPGGVDGVFVTGSSSSVHHQEPWSVRCGAWLAEAHDAGVPILGVCYGHQLLADTLGGAAGPNPHGREIGVCDIEVIVDDPLFEGLGPLFPAIETHVDAVLDLPPGATVLARTPLTPVQAMALGPNTRTVQFHPEFDAEAIRTVIAARAHLIDAESGPGAAERLLAAVVECDTGATLLRNFARHWLGLGV